MLPSRPMLSVRLKILRGGLVEVFPHSELASWRSEQWWRQPVALASELERLQQLVTDPDQLRLLVKAYTTLLLAHKNVSDLWTIARADSLLSAESGLMAKWSGRKSQEANQANVARRDASLRREAAQEVLKTGDPKIKIGEIAKRLVKRHPVKFDRTRHIIAETVRSTRSSLAAKK